MNHIKESNKTDFYLDRLGVYPVLLCQDGMTRGRGVAAYVRDGYGAFRKPKFECGCSEMLVFRVCGARQNLYIFSLYRNPDLDDRIYECLRTAKAVMHSVDVRESLLFMGDLNDHRQEWLGYTSTNRHGFAVPDFPTVSGCDLLVIGPTHAHGGTLDLLTSRPSTGGCCSTTRQFGSFITAGSHLDCTGYS